jgi:hypothetical protein
MAALGMANTPVTDRWPDIRRAAEQGVPLKMLSDEFGITYDAVRKRAQREKWLTGPVLMAKAAEMSQKVRQPALSGPPDSEKSGGDKDIAEVIVRNWAEKGEQVRNLAWSIGQSSLKGLDKTGIPVKDAGDAAKLIKMMREATGQFQDQPLVQMAVFNGANSGFDVETVQSDTVIMEDGVEYETEM